MIPTTLSERLDILIDDLIMDGSVDCVSLASILLAARDSLKRDDSLRLSQRVWSAIDEQVASERRDEVPLAG